jgi:hypothetical protein
VAPECDGCGLGHIFPLPTKVFKFESYRPFVFELLAVVTIALLLAVLMGFAMGRTGGRQARDWNEANSQK